MKKKRIKIAAAAVIFTLLIGIGVTWGYDRFFTPAPDEKEQAREELLDQGIINVLLLGIDARPGETKARSDTMILVSIDTTNKKAGLISIPRDTRIKDGNNYQKINAYNFIGGPELAKEKVEELIGVPVHYYAMTNFSGFQGIIDVLGGVTIDVDKRMYKPSEDIDLQPGIQRLNGKQALAYCRYRNDALGDIARIQRQQNFLLAVAEEIMQPSTLAKLPKLLPKIAECVTTDIPMSKMLKVAQAAEQFRQGQSQMVAQALPGWFYNDPETGASYWVVDEQKLPGIVDNVLNGKIIADFIEGTLDGGQVASKPKKTDQSEPKKDEPASPPSEQEENPDDGGDIVQPPTDDQDSDKEGDQSTKQPPVSAEPDPGYDDQTQS